MFTGIYTCHVYMYTCVYIPYRRPTNVHIPLAHTHSHTPTEVGSRDPLFPRTNGELVKGDSGGVVAQGIADTYRDLVLDGGEQVHISDVTAVLEGWVLLTDHNFGAVPGGGVRPRHSYQNQGPGRAEVGGRSSKARLGSGWWTQGEGGVGRGQRSGLELGGRRVYSHHSNVEGVGDVGGDRQMPAAVEALRVSVGAAAEHGLPWRHWGEDSMVKAFLEPPVPCTSVGTGGPQNPSSPPPTHQQCQRLKGGGGRRGLSARV